MKLTLSLESEEVEGLPDETIIEETGEEINEQVMLTFKKMDSFFEVIDNLKQVQSNIKRFGVTKELLHLVNTDNQLGKVLDISLPYYEDDDGDIEIDNVPDAEELVAATEGVIGKAKDGIIKFFKWIKEKLSQFWTWVKGLFGKTEKEIKAAQETIKPENIAKEVVEQLKTEEKQTGNSPLKTAADLGDNNDEEIGYSFVMKQLSEIHKSDDLEITFITKKEFDSYFSKFENLTNALSMVDFNTNEGTITNGVKLEEAISAWTNVNPEYKNLAIKYIDYHTSNTSQGIFIKNKVSPIEVWIKNMKDQVNESTLKGLGYANESDLIKCGDRITALLKSQNKLQKMYNTMDKKSQEYTKKYEAGIVSDSVAVSLSYENMANNMKFLFSLWNDQVKLLNVFVKIYQKGCIKYKHDVIAKLIKNLK